MSMGGSVNPFQVDELNQQEETKRLAVWDRDLIKDLNAYIKRFYIGEKTTLVFHMDKSHTHHSSIWALYAIEMTDWLMNEFYDYRGLEPLRRVLKSYENNGWQVRFQLVKGCFGLHRWYEIIFKVRGRRHTRIKNP
jgi:hypothetical protein